MHIDSITKYIGYCLFIMGFLRVFDVIQQDSVYLMGFSIAALLITIAQTLDERELEKNTPDKYRKIIIVLYFFAAFSFTIIPSIIITWDEKVVSKINDVCVYLSLGIIFIINASKNSKKVLDFVMNKIDEILPQMSEEATSKALNELMDYDKIEEMTREAIAKIKAEQEHLKE